MRFLRALLLLGIVGLPLGALPAWSENPQIPVPIHVVDTDIELDFTQISGAPSVRQTGPPPTVLVWDFGADGAGEYSLNEDDGVLLFDIRSISGASTATARPLDITIELEIPDLGDPTTTVAFRLVDEEATHASATPRFRVANFYESEILGPAVKFPFEEFDLLINLNPINPIPGSTSLIAFAAGDRVRLQLTGFGSGFRLDRTGARLRYRISASALTGSAFHPPARPRPFRLDFKF